MRKLSLAGVVAPLVLSLAGAARAQQCTTPFDPSCHNLKCYKIGGPVFVQPLQLDDQFGRERVFTLVPQFLCNPTLKSCCVKKPDGTFDCSKPSAANCPPDPSQPNQPVPVDHFKCYKINVKECPPCTPSPTNANCVATAAGAFDCTKLTGRFPPIPPPIQVQLIDQFHQEKVNVGPPKMLCVPVVKVVVSPTTTTTRVPTTTTTIPCHAPDAAGACNGDCPSTPPNNMKCLATSASSCDCVPVNQMCMQPAGATCGGLCPNINQLCGIDVTTNMCTCGSPCGGTPPTCGGVCPPSPTHPVQCVPQGNGCVCM